MNDAMADFYRCMIAEWEAKLNKAAQDGDYASWQQAERELENYKQMLERAK